MFAIALCLRVPCCLESLWLDELHSSWTVWGDLSDVEPRARMGNQTPYFFWLLWGWCQIVGDSELALRLSSAFFSSGACALLAAGVSLIRRNTLIGISAGLVLAVERNSLFFGTEFRGYAAIVFLATLLVLLAARLLAGSSIRTRVALAVTSGLLFMVNFTTAMLSAAVIGMLASASQIRKFVRTKTCDHEENEGAGAEKSQTLLGWIDLVLMMLAIGLVAAWEHQAISQLWTRRDNWTAFAVPDYLRFAGVWPWESLVLVPLVIAVILWLATWLIPAIRCDHALIDNAWLWVPLLSIVLLMSAVVYLLADYGIVSLWHRRYIVGLLPVLAWGSAELWFAAGGQLRFFRYVLPLVIALALMYQQGTLSIFTAPNRPLVSRPENWQAATRWIREDFEQGDAVRVDSGLIEAKLIDQQESADQKIQFAEYLCCPVNNLYAVPGPLPISTAARSRQGWTFVANNVVPSQRSAETRGRIWLIIRNGRADRLKEIYRAGTAAKIKGFGIAEITESEVLATRGVSVVKILWRVERD